MNCRICGVSLPEGDVCPRCHESTEGGASTTGARQRSGSGPGMPEPLAPTGAAPVVLSERFEVLRTLGMGGVGVVYLGREKSSGDLLALKVLRPALRTNRQVLARFHREVEIARRIRHPNVARVYALHETEAHVFIVMQYVDGMDLNQYLRRVKPTLEQKLAILKAVCAAVDAAHAAGVVHRDLKPGNIMVARNGTPFVLDFGVASTEEDSDITRVGSFIGTPLYMSPEQAQGKKVDQRSDIYSLGAIFYELVTGRPPFIGESAVTIALKHVREAPFRPRSLNPKVPAIIEKVILWCLEKAPSSRPQTASEIIRQIEEPLARDLEAALASVRRGVAEPQSGDLDDISLFQYLRVLAPVRRNFVLEIVNNEEFGRYHFKGAHLVHAEAGNLRDAEVAYNLFYWTRGIYRIIDDPDPQTRETVRIPWIPFVESYFAALRKLVAPVHAVVPGPLLLDLLDPRGLSVYRYVSEPGLEGRLGERARMSLETFQKARTHLKVNETRKLSKNGPDCGVLFCYRPGLRHYFYAVTEPRAEIDELYRWIKTDLEPSMVEALHRCLLESDQKLLDARRVLKILVVEHEEFLGNLIRIKLRAQGRDVYLVRDGSRALETVPQLVPDLVVLDVDVPGTSGYDLCRAMAASPQLQDIPIVLLAPEQKHDVLRDTEVPGVARILEKPIVLGELVELIERHARRRDRKPPEQT